MPPDDLNAPLGQDKPKKPPISGCRPANSRGHARAVRHRGRSLGGLRQRSPRRRADRGGRHQFAGQEAGPPPATAQQQHSHHDGTTTVAAPANTSASAGAASAPPGSKTVTIIDGSSGKHQDVIIPGKSSGNAPKAPLDMRFWRIRATAPSRRSRRTACGRSRSTPIRAKCRRARATRRASPSSSAGSASAHPAPPTHWRNCRRR